MERRFSKYILEFPGIVNLTVSALIMHYLLLMGNNKDIFGTLYRIIAMTYPFTFSIKNKTFRCWAITLSSIVMFISQSWIGFACMLITWLVFFWQKRYWVFGVLFCLGTLAITNKLLLGNFMHDASTRIMIYKHFLGMWHNFWWGEGVNHIFLLKPWIKGKFYLDMHSDVLQMFVELGVARAVPILFLLLLPILFIKNTKILAGYLCFLFQCAFDFPMHRVSTMFLSMYMILLAYKDAMEGNKNGTAERY